MTLDEAIETVVVQVAEALDVDKIPLVKEALECPAAIRLSRKQMAMVAFGPDVHPISAFLTMIAIGLAAGRMVGRAEAETAALEKLFDKEEK